MRALLIGYVLCAGWAGCFAAEFWDIRIEFGEEQRARLVSAPREWVPATVTVGETPAVSARVKLKGRGTFQSFSEKPSFTIEVAPEHAEAAPYSSTKIHLNNSADDASYLKEQLGRELFSSVGIPAPRVGHARVTVNDRELGLYVLKEGFDEKFARRELGEGAAIYDNDPESGGGLDLDTGKDRSDRVKQLWRAAEVESEKRFEKLSEVLDVESFVKFLAMEVLICHWDGYGLSENNFRIAVRADGKIQFLPAGMDQIFSNAKLPWQPEFSGKVAKSFMETKEGPELYRKVMKQLAGEILDAKKISNRVAQFHAGLEPNLTGSERSQIRGELTEFSDRIAARESSLKEQLRETEATLFAFVDGLAMIRGWRAMDEPDGGKMLATESALTITAGPKTSAAWNAKVRLPPGRYTLATNVRTEGVKPLPIGVRQGACLRVMGRSAHSETLVGSTNAVLRCAFELSATEEVTLLCELRASAGRAEFAKPVQLRIESGIPAKKK